MSRQLLAFKRVPTVELRFEDLNIEVKPDRVVLSTAADDELHAWFSWEEWRDLARRVEHSMQWIDANTQEDVTGASFGIEPE
jgi:hypothetical protein